VLNNALTQSMQKVNTGCVAPVSVPIAAQGVSFFGPDYTNLEAQHEAWWRAASYEYVWGMAGFRQAYENGAGNFRAIFDIAGGGYVPVPGWELTIQPLQLSGLIQQPTKVRVLGWASVAPLFPVAIRDFWNGDLDTRSAYTASTCQWDVPASAPFGGARVYYSQSRPEAASGCAWVVEISTSTGIHWEGVKTIGDGPDGLYHKTGISAASPACIRIENKEIWELNP